MPGLQELTARQRALLQDWLPGFSVVSDHSWGLVGTSVLELVQSGGRYIVKAGDDRDRHISRELHAHQHWLAPLTSRQRAPRLVHGDVEAKLLLCQYVAGSLVEGAEEEWQEDTYRQAGQLLALLHGQSASNDDRYEALQDAKALRWLDGPHGIAAAVVKELRSRVQSWPQDPVAVVPTHGDWQPRNWLTHDGLIYAIDFGRAEPRPAFTDFARLHVRQFRAKPALATAFLAGYGPDPRVPGAWQRQLLREAIGTACWAHQVGDSAFEAEGLRMIADALSDDDL
jgi:hypothetical protein